MATGTTATVLALIGGAVILAVIAPLFFDIGGTGNFQTGTAINFAERAFCIIDTSPTNATCDQVDDTLILLGNGIDISSDFATDTVTFTANFNDTTTASNIGSGSEVFAQQVLDNLEFRTLTTSGNGVELTQSANEIQFNLNAIPKSAVSDTGTWEVSEIPVLTRAKISDFLPITKVDVEDTGTFGWSEISKSGSFLNEIGAPTSSYGFNSQIITSYGTPVSSTDVQRVDRLGLQDLDASELCTNGQGRVFNSTTSKFQCVANGSGEANTVSNIGTGDGWFKQKVGVNFEFKTVIGTTGITVTNNANDLTLGISSISKNQVDDAGQFGWSEINKTGSFLNEIGAPTSSYGFNSQRLTGLGTPTSSTDAQRADKIGNATISFNTFPTNNQIPKYNSTSNQVEWQADTDTNTGENNTDSNVGTGDGWFKQKVGFNSEFKSVIGSGGITVTNNANDLTLGISSISKNQVDDAGQFGWTEINKTGSILNDIGAPTSSYSFNSQRLTSLGLPTSATDAQRMDRIGNATITLTPPTDMLFARFNSTSNQVEWLAGNAGENTTATNLGAGRQVFAQEVGDQLQFRTITTSGGGLSSSNSSTTITITLEEIPKSQIDGAGTWAVSDIPILPKTKINTTGVFDWTEINKTGSILNDIGAPTSSYSFNSQRLTSLGTPISSTDAQRMDRIANQTISLTAPTNNQIPKFNSTSNQVEWQTDAGGTVGNTIEQGNSYVNVTDTGTGQVNIGIDGTVEFQFFANLLDTLGATIDNVGALISNSGNPADSGAIRLGNNELIGWEASPSGTDVDLRVDSSEDFLFSSSANNINLNSNPITGGILGALLDTSGNRITSLPSTLVSTTDAQRADRIANNTISFTAPTNNQVLKFNTTSNQAEWQTDAGGSSSGTSGQVAWWNATNTLTSSSTLQYDNSLNRLGVGGTPTATFHVIASGSVSQRISSGGDNTQYLQVRIPDTTSVFLEHTNSGTTRTEMKFNGTGQKAIHGGDDGTLASGNVPTGSVVISNGALCVDNGTAACDDANRTRGQIYAKSITITAIDLAENYPIAQPVKAGDVVCHLKNGNFAGFCGGRYDTNVLGIVSTSPAIVLGSSVNTKQIDCLDKVNQNEDACINLKIPEFRIWEQCVNDNGGDTEVCIDLHLNSVFDQMLNQKSFFQSFVDPTIEFAPIALAGRVPVKVDCSFPITEGDPLVSGDTDGIAISYFSEKAGVAVIDPNTGLASLDQASVNKLFNLSGAVFARALESCPSGTATIEAWVS